MDPAAEQFALSRIARTLLEELSEGSEYHKTERLEMILLAFQSVKRVVVSQPEIKPKAKWKAE